MSTDEGEKGQTVYLDGATMATLRKLGQVTMLPIRVIIGLLVKKVRPEDLTPPLVRKE